MTKCEIIESREIEGLRCIFILYISQYTLAMKCIDMVVSKFVNRVVGLGKNNPREIPVSTGALHYVLREMFLACLSLTACIATQPQENPTGRQKLSMCELQGIRNRVAIF